MGDAGYAGDVEDAQILRSTVVVWWRCGGCAYTDDHRCDMVGMRGMRVMLKS